MIKLLIYDLDGTLIDSCQDIASCVNRTLGELGFRALPVEIISSYVGKGVRSLMTSVLSTGLSHAKIPEDKMIDRAIKLYKGYYAKHLLDETKLFPSVQAVLEHFKDRKQAVMTNKPEAFSHTILRGLGVDHYFFRLLGGDSGFPKKPAPEPILHLIELVRVSPQEAVLIGDSEIDVETGKRAGIRTVAVTYGFSSKPIIEQAKPDFIYSDLNEIVDCPILVEKN
ncbi:MAG: HAD-IA family hydrolase [Candidatus Omnitrophica bacterium]|nr:HAD-IA family hydrolase [Candidatus Omnitrophota bacterium]